MISPCKKICTLDEQTKVCTSCGRTLAEIARWSAMGDVERRDIMASLEERLDRLSSGMESVQERNGGAKAPDACKPSFTRFTKPSSER